MTNFDKDNIEVREFVVFEDMIFLDEDELMKYIDSCDAKFETYNFYLDSDDVYEFADRSELLALYDDDEDELYTAERTFDKTVKELMSKYDISYNRGGRTGSGRRYKLCGTYGNLKKFAEEYCGYIDLSNPGEHLSDCAERAEIDLESGDDEYIIGNLSL